MSFAYDDKMIPYLVRRARNLRRETRRKLRRALARVQQAQPRPKLSRPDARRLRLATARDRSRALADSRRRLALSQGPL